jgi:excisionase family DNA binding protein
MILLDSLGNYLTMNTYYKVEEASKILKVKPITVRRWCKVGLLKAKKLGKSWYIPEDELDLFKDISKDSPFVEKK